MFEVHCKCGNRTPVTAGQAGSMIECKCGQAIEVPAYSKLRQVAEAAGRPMRLPPARHDWTVWWCGIALLVTGELAKLVGLTILGSQSGETNALGLVSFIALVLGYIMSIVGMFVVGLGKGFAMWFCMVLVFCIPFGGFVILFFPGKGMDREA